MVHDWFWTKKSGNSRNAFNLYIEEVKEQLKKEILNKDESIDGILVQMPLPKHLDSSVIQNTIDSYKDVDGLTDINAGRLLHNKDSLVACTSLGIIELLKYYNIDIIVTIDIFFFKTFR